MIDILLPGILGFLYIVGVYINYRIYWRLLVEAGGGREDEAAFVIAALFALIPLVWVFMTPIGILRLIWKVRHQ